MSSKENTSLLNLARLSINMYTRIDREDLNLVLSCLDLREIRTPGDTNAFRTAVRYKIKEIGSWEYDGYRCKLLVEEAKIKGMSVDMWIHLKKVGHGVDYSRCLLRVGITEEGKPFVHPLDKDETQAATAPETEPSRAEEIALKYCRDQHLDNVQSMIDFGQRYAFQKHIRTVAETILSDGCVKIWNRSGLWLTTSEEDLERIRMVEEIFNPDDLSSGHVIVSKLSLENSPANRKRLAAELKEQYEEALETIEEALDEVGPILSKLERDLLEIGRNVVTIEKGLGVNLNLEDRLLEIGGMIAKAKAEEGK